MNEIIHKFQKLNIILNKHKNNNSINVQAIKNIRAEANIHFDEYMYKQISEDCLYQKIDSLIKEAEEVTNISEREFSIL